MSLTNWLKNKKNIFSILISYLVTKLNVPWMASWWRWMIKIMKLKNAIRFRYRSTSETLKRQNWNRRLSRFILKTTLRSPVIEHVVIHSFNETTTMVESFTRQNALEQEGSGEKSFEEAQYTFFHSVAVETSRTIS